MIAAVADTHAIIWYLFNHPNLSTTAKNVMDNAAKQGDQIAISSITLIEMVYLIEKGRIAAESFSRLAAILETTSSTLIEIPITLDVGRSLARVDVAQIPDMPDRIVAATAMFLNVPVISRDGKIRLSSLATVW